MNRWQALQQVSRVQPRRNLSGTYIDDRASAGGLLVPPAAPFDASLLPPGPPMLAPVNGRNLSQEEATAASDALRLRPPALLVKPGAGGVGGAANAAGQVPTIQPPWSQTPAGGQPFTFMPAATVLLPAQGATVIVVTFQVPRRKNGVIEFIANQFVGGGWTEGTGDLVWRITADDVPVQGYDNITASMGALSNPGWLGTRIIRISENQIIALTLTNVGIVVPAGQVLLGLFRGGFYPIEQEGQDTWL